MLTGHGEQALGREVCDGGQVCAGLVPREEQRAVSRRVGLCYKG